MLLSWLLLTSPLGNLLRQFNSPRNCIPIVKEFRDELGKIIERGGCQLDLQVDDEASTTTQVPCLLWTWLATEGDDSTETLDEYLNKPYHSMPVYKSNKQLQGGTKLCLFVSTLHVVFSFVSAFSALWTPPTYFVCRHIMVIVIFLLWLLSPILTKVLNCNRKSDETRWFLVLFKDFCIAGPILTFLIASSCGLFSSCWCLSGIMFPGNKAEVQLNPEPDFKSAHEKLYPGVVTANIGLLILLLLCIVWGLGWKKIWVMRMTESEKKVALNADVSVFGA